MTDRSDIVGVEDTLFKLLLVFKLTISHLRILLDGKRAIVLNVDANIFIALEIKKKISF